MHILMVSANFFPASPAGPASIAGALREAGHEVSVFDAFLANDPNQDIAAAVTENRPDLIGLSIRSANGYVNDRSHPDKARSFNHRNRVHALVARIQSMSDAPIVAGGSGFDCFAEQWLSVLNLDYGLRGEGEKSFPKLVEAIAAGNDVTRVPGAIGRSGTGFFRNDRPRCHDLDSLPYPAYDLFDLDRYCEMNIATAVETKRGCPNQCIFCAQRHVAGTRYRLKSPARVAAEIERLSHPVRPTRIVFVDSAFNMPHGHAEAILAELIERRLVLHWETNSLSPLNVTDDFCRLANASGCRKLVLTVTSANDRMLAISGRGYHADHIKAALTVLSRNQMPFGISLLFGAPGETAESIAETLALVDQYDIPGEIWVSLGISLWTEHQEIVGIARQQGMDVTVERMFDGCSYLSPTLREEDVRALVHHMRERPNVVVQALTP